MGIIIMWARLKNHHAKYQNDRYENSSLEKRLFVSVCATRVSKRAR